jgi:hypothetical protein
LNNFEGLGCHLTSHFFGGVFSSAVRKREDWNIQNYNFACSFVWVSNVSNTWGVWEQYGETYLDPGLMTYLRGWRMS